MTSLASHQTAASAGRELNAYLRTTQVQDLDSGRIVALVESLARAPCETLADVLALIALADEISRMALVACDASSEAVPSLLRWVRILHQRAIAVLEGASGATAAGFTGCGPIAH